MADSRADYTHGGATGLISERAGSTSRFYHGASPGSTRGLTDGTEAVTGSREYDAFGLTLGGTGSFPTPFGFVGGEGYQTDPDSGLMLLGARYYDPSTGRFISRDPIGYEGGLNLYGYCLNDSVNDTDPSGLATWWEKLRALLEAVARLYTIEQPPPPPPQSPPRPRIQSPVQPTAASPPSSPEPRPTRPPLPRPPTRIGVPRGGYRPPIRLGGGGYGGGGMTVIVAVGVGIGTGAEGAAYTYRWRQAIEAELRRDPYGND